jgi:micrococcal nuclease
MPSIKRVQVSRVVSVFDGDTFRCDVDTWPKLFGWKIPVRIAGINCPERKNADPSLQEKAELARRFTDTALTNAKRIILCNVKRGKYFRIIADVEIDGADLGSALLSNGLAVRRTYK